MTYLQAERRYSEHTLKAYRSDINQFHAFCLEKGHEGMELYFKVIRSWVVALMDAGYSSGSVHRKLSSLKSYCNYLIRIGELDANPLDRVLKPKTKKRVPVFVEEVQMDRLLDDYDFGDDYEGIRNRLMLDLLYQTGIRRAELIRLTTGSVHTEEKTLKVVGKRNKERIIPLGDDLVRRIGEYLTIRDTLPPSAGENALLLTRKGNPLYDKLVYRVVLRYLAMVTTLDKRSPHVLRHTFATHMLNRGADLNTIKELLGHANLSATQVYTHNTFEKLKSIYNQAHPRA